MTALPVQCCCEPGKRLGWLQLPVTVSRPMHLRLAVRDGVVAVDVRQHHSVPYPESVYVCDRGATHVTIPLTVRRLAVSSHDRALEEWTRIPGFTVDPPWARP